MEWTSGEEELRDCMGPAGFLPSEAAAGRRVVEEVEVRSRASYVVNGTVLSTGG